jgi:hypothetical protein
LLCPSRCASLPCWLLLLLAQLLHGPDGAAAQQRQHQQVPRQQVPLRQLPGGQPGQQLPLLLADALGLAQHLQERGRDATLGLLQHTRTLPKRAASSQ